MDAVTLIRDRVSPYARVQIFSQQSKTPERSTKEATSKRLDFPDPRLFDYDQNGRVDANDVIQERSAREELRAAPVEEKITGQKDEAKNQISLIA